MRWSRPGVFDRILAALTGQNPKAADHDGRNPSEGAPHGDEPAQKGLVPVVSGRTQSGLNSKLHAACEKDERRVAMLLSDGQMSDQFLLDALPSASHPIADRDCDSM